MPRSRAGAAALAICLGVWACATSPLGRRQLVLFPGAEMNAMGVAAFSELKQKTPLSSDAKLTAYVECVAHAVTDSLQGPWAGRNWEVQLFEDDAANAFALPGGKIGVFTGLLDVAKNRDQLATVLGHEVAHVLANHSNERMSTAYAAQAGMAVAGSAAGLGAGAMDIAGLLVNVGGLLPFNRKQEAEADLVGLDLMARAGFDPRASVDLWMNMAANREGAPPPEFLSTHPADATRIGGLRARLPRTVEIYEAAKSGGRRPRC